MGELHYTGDGGDAIGETSIYAIAYNNPSKLNPLHDLYKEGILYRSFNHLNDGINTMSRDHIFRLKIATKFFNINNFDYIFEPVTPRGKLSDKYKSTPDFWLFIKDYNLLWQLSLLYWPLLILWTYIVKKIGGINDTDWDSFKTLPYIRNNNNEKIFLKATNSECKKAGWKNKLQYLCARWVPRVAYYAHNQTCWALYVSKKIPVLTSFLQWSFIKGTWKNNPEILLLCGKNIDGLEYPDLARTSHICARVPNQFNDITPDGKDKNKFFVKVIESLKKH